MKSPKQWKDEYWQDSKLDRADRKLSFSNGDLVRAIQLDAMKEGLMRARDIIGDRERLLEQNGARELIREHCHRQAILEYANQLTESDFTKTNQLTTCVNSGKT